jgi:CheY-like chemotaxis protein/anti-sigma regulatory factor (Ser/Thr protein kinase)
MNQLHNVHSDSQANEGKTVLVVDDVADVTEMLAVLLSHMGHKVVTASSARTALRFLRENKVDALISDIGMPEMNGYQLAREVRSLPGYESIPIIAVTGYSMFDDKERSINAGFNAHMTKPIDPRALIDLLNMLLDESRSEMEHLRTSQVEQHKTSEPEKHEKKNKKKAWRLFRGKDNTEATDPQHDKKPDAIYSVIAHDLKNEFSIIGTEARRIRALVDGLSDVVESCDRIDRSVAYSRQRLLLLLTYAGLARPIFSSTEVTSLIDRIEWLIKPRLQSGVELSIKADPKVVNKTITTDIEQVTLVLQELVNNAADELFQTGGNIEIGFDGRGNWLVISVKDSGPGVSKEIERKLFTRQVRTKKAQGLGLGLFLSSKVIQSLGGKLYLEESSEQGSTFTISLSIV